MRRIVLLGAPSGAGKSTFSQQLIKDGLALRAYDFKAMPVQILDGSIIEVATNKWAKTTASHAWHDLLLQLGEFDHITCVQLIVPPRTIAKQYLKRLVFEYPWRNMAKPRAWILGLSYLWPNKVTKAENAWQEFERYLIERYPERTNVMRIHVRGDNAAQGIKKAAQKPARA